MTIFATDRSMAVVELAREVEDRGLSSLWVPEHTHIPTSRRTPAPMGGGDLPVEYRRTLDPLVALSAVAASTEHLRVGTGILLAAQRDPIVTAKALATLDHLCAGRLDVGVGYGWNEDEMNHHGVARENRRVRTAEHVQAMQAIWTREEAEFSGEHVSFGPSWSWPKPVQSPLPVLFGGGAGPTLFRHVAEMGQGWIPIGGSGLGDGVSRLRDAMAEAGRGAEGVRVVPFGSDPTPGKLEHFEQVGVTEVVFRLPSAGRDEVLEVLDRHTEMWEAHHR